MVATVVFAGLLIGAACARPASSSGGGGTPDQIYAAGPTVSDVRTALGSDTWWPVTPSFLIRPLGLPTMPANVRFEITQRYAHLGSSELFIANYSVWSSTFAASAYFTSVQNAANTVNGPRAGDQVIYYGMRSPDDTSLFDTTALVRLGQVLIIIDLTRGQGFADLNLMGRLASKLVSRLKSALAGKVKPSPLPSSDKELLLPLGTDVTFAAAVRLPIEAAALLLGASAPQDVVDQFTKLNVKDFLYADYALNADLNMEVRAIVFSFSSPSDAMSWTDFAIGAGNLNAQGVASGYVATIGQYVAFILSGSHVGLLFCNALSAYEAASRACETPIASLIGSWQTRLA